MVDEAGHEVSVIPNTKLKGQLSGTLRQIDVLIDYRFEEDVSRRVIVDAKRHKRPIDVKHVEEFEGMMRDVRASHGVIVCPNGHTKAALRRAQDLITIRLVGLDELDTMDLMAWEPCRHEECGGFVLWDTNPSLEIDGLLAIFATGKCDQCNRFNVWCWDCTERFALDDEDEHQCACKGVWFWLTAIEDEGEEVENLKAVYLLLCYPLDAKIVDRRPLS